MTISRKNPLRRLLTGQDGSSIVEFAVISPVMFTLLMGGFDFGHNLYIQSVLQGAVNKAARDSSLETGTQEEKQEKIDDRVQAQVLAVHPGAKIPDSAFTRSYFRSFTKAAAPQSEEWADTNLNGECDNDENFTDDNNNGEFDEDGLAAGQGGTNDAVRYSATVRYTRLFPFPTIVGLEPEVVMTASTVIANQPYGDAAPPGSGKCEDI